MLNEKQARALVQDSIVKAGGRKLLSPRSTLAEAGMDAAKLPVLIKEITSDPSLGIVRFGLDIAMKTFGTLIVDLSIDTLAKAIVEARVVCGGRYRHVQEPPYPAICPECGSSVP